MSSLDLDNLPDIRDGLSRKERIVLYCIDQIQKERNDRNVPTVMLYGRVVEHINISEQELQEILQRLTGFNQ
ncbi:MAG: hypothetical protein OEZ16_09965 [Chromatiales bacterium]|nr:hypothetical protein [Chromatiales bacterium]